MSIVPTSSVKITEGYEPLDYEVRKVMPILVKQGLIEPLKMDQAGEIGRIDCHDPARLEACKQLAWETVNVAYDKEDIKYRR